MPTPAAEPEALSLEELEAEVNRLHKRAQELNKRGGRWTEEATQVYKQMAALDDRALALAMAAAVPPSPAARQRHTAEHPAYATLHSPSLWPGDALAADKRNKSAGIKGPGVCDRATAAVLGAVVADAAAQGVHWVYDVEQLAAWEAERRAADPGAGLEFMEPPRNPFYTYASGRASSYGEQTLVLLRSLAEARGLDCRRYAETLWAAFGPGFDGYRDVSTKAFLRRYAAGLLPPATGAPSDQQANAFTRLPPLVALYAGDPRLGLVVEAMIRVTQNDDAAVAYGLVAAAVLEQLLLGEPSVTAVVARTAQRFQQRAAAAAGPGAEDALAGRVASPELAGQVAAALLRTLELAPQPPHAVRAVLGHNCHLPTSLQTALHVLLHLERGGGGAERGVGEQQQQAAGAAGSRGGEEWGAGQAAAAAAVGSGAALQQEGPQGLGEGTPATEDASAFCLPCSMGQCEWWPRASFASAAEAAAGTAAPTEKAPAAGAGEPRAAPLGPWVQAHGEGAFIEAVRAALREGGCCASRAAFVGACLGALGGQAVVPQAWQARVRGLLMGDTEGHLKVLLMGLRDS